MGDRRITRGDLFKVIWFKVIWHIGQGPYLFSKRLERRRFIWPSPADGATTISEVQLGYLLFGIDWHHPQKTRSLFCDGRWILSLNLRANVIPSVCDS